MIDKFNLIVSTGTDFEIQAESELWFNLLSVGDKSPIIFKSEISGIILAYSSIDPKILINYLHDILVYKNPNYCQFIQKIIPIHEVTTSEVNSIRESSLKLIKNHPYCIPNSEYRITIRKRRTKLESKELIDAIADSLKFKVNLQNYNWRLQIEIIGNYTGLAILRDSDVLRPNHLRKKLNKS